SLPIAMDLISETGAKPARLASTTPRKTVMRRDFSVSAASGVMWPPVFSVTVEPGSSPRASVSVMISKLFMLGFSAMPTSTQPAVLIDHDELAARIGALAQEIRTDYPN